MKYVIYILSTLLAASGALFAWYPDNEIFRKTGLACLIVLLSIVLGIIIVFATKQLKRDLE